jgi:hypothetical protein
MHQNGGMSAFRPDASRWNHADLNSAIGYATSPDGKAWKRMSAEPVLSADKPWEKVAVMCPDVIWDERTKLFGPGAEKVFDQARVTGCQVLQARGGWYYMFYIGFRDIDHAQIGLARSRDGVTGWQRHPANPIVRPGQDAWDHDACYKPYAIFDGRKWLLWYNGRHSGLALHDGEDLGFGR